MPTTTTGASVKTGASGRSKGAATQAEKNGRVKTIKVKTLQLTIPHAIPLGTFRAAFKEESTNEDVVTFLNAVLGEDQMELVWALPLDLSGGPIADQVRGLLAELQDKVQKAIGLEAGE